MSHQRTFYTGTVEYLEVTVSADFQLAGQPVALSFDRRTWIPAEWQGAPGESRAARILLDKDTLPDRGEWTVFVRITDNPEIPVFPAGSIRIR